MSYTSIKDFANTAPASESINVLYDSTGKVLGMTVWNITNNLEVKLALENTLSFKFYELGIENFKIEEVVNKGSYSYLHVKSGNTGSLDVNITYTNTGVLLEPYLNTNFENTEYNLLINNVIRSRKSRNTFNSDRTLNYQLNGVTHVSQPQNFELILDSTATMSTKQDFLEYSTGLRNSRYEGSKNTENPALVFKSFRGSVHSAGSSLQEIKKTELPERVIEDIYFSTTFDRKYQAGLQTGSAIIKAISDYPQTTGFNSENSYENIITYIYRRTGGRFVLLTSQKVYGIDSSEVYSTGETGNLTLVN